MIEILSNTLAEARERATDAAAKFVGKPVPVRLIRSDALTADASDMSSGARNVVVGWRTQWDFDDPNQALSVPPTPPGPRLDKHGWVR